MCYMKPGVHAVCWFLVSWIQIPSLQTVWQAGFGQLIGSVHSCFVILHRRRGERLIIVPHTSTYWSLLYCLNYILYENAKKLHFINNPKMGENSLVASSLCQHRHPATPAVDPRSCVGPLHWSVTYILALIIVRVDSSQCGKFQY